MQEHLDSRTLAVGTVAAVLVFAGIAVTGVSEGSAIKSNQLWAQATLYSLPAKDVDPTMAFRLYSEAIQKSHAPATLYVAYGDFLRGPLPFSVSWNAIFQDHNRIYRAATQPDVSEAMISEIMRLIDDDSASLSMYQAAIQHDPNHSLAHFRIAVHGNGEAALRSSQWLTHNDPANSLGPFLESLHHSENAPDKFIELVKLANSRPVLCLYPDPIPRHTHVMYPDFFGEIRGRLVPNSVYFSIVRRQNTWMNFNDPLETRFEQILDRLLSLSKLSPNLTREILYLHQASCHQIAFNTDAQLLLLFTAYSRCKESHQLLQGFGPSNSPASIATDRKYKQMGDYIESVRSIWMPWATSQPSRLTGESLDVTGDFVMQETALRKRLLNKALAQ